jgi:hypothetical protein
MGLILGQRHHYQYEIDCDAFHPRASTPNGLYWANRCQSKACISRRSANSSQHEVEMNSLTSFDAGKSNRSRINSKVGTTSGSNQQNGSTEADPNQQFYLLELHRTIRQADANPKRETIQGQQLSEDNSHQRTATFQR